MGWVLGIVLYLLCGLMCAVISAKIEASDPDDSFDADNVLVAILFAWPMLLVILIVMGSFRGLEKLVLWLAKTIPDVKFTSKEK